MLHLPGLRGRRPACTCSTSWWGGRECLFGVGLLISHEPQALGCGNIQGWGRAHVLGDRKVLAHQLQDPLPVRPNLTLGRAGVCEAVSQAVCVSLEFATYH